MKLRLYSRGEVLVLEPVGNIRSEEEVAKLDEKLYSILGRGKKKVVVDLGRTIWLSSRAISTLLNHNIRFREAGGRLLLANLTNKIEELIAITRLASFFEVHDTLGAAVDSFEKKIDASSSLRPI
ncbi:MAG TPA: STAS domain-containing protein [Terriglobales bacterium]|nr:STAS domain-containing protein [Terriglobales bacterium]